MRIARFAAVVAAALMVLGSCASQGTAAKRPPKEKSVEERLSGKVWLLAGYAAGETFIPIEPGHGSSGKLVFAADRTLSGSTGWNAIAGSWSIRKESRPGQYPLSLKVVRSTKLAPPGDVAARYERDIMRHFAKTVSIRLTRDEFRLLDEKGTVLLHYIFRSAGL